MKTIKKTNQVVALVMIAAIIFTHSCKKESLNESAGLSAADNQNVSKKTVSSPWHKMSSGVSAPHRGIIEMSTFSQTTCYGVMYDDSGNPPYQDISITHNGGATWQVQSIAGLENNYLLGVAATSSKIVHVFGYNYVSGGGTVFRSTDGGATWQREAANAYNDPASFPDDIKFFDSKNGVMFGDPQDGYFEIYTTSDGGDSWKRVPSNKVPVPLPNEYGVTYHTDTYKNTYWVITSTLDSNFNPVSSRLLQSDDKGLSWYVKNPYLTFNGWDGTIKFRNESVGLYKNNAILYRTTNGGTTWNVVNYSGTWFSFDFDNIPGKPGWWISTGGGTPGNVNSAYGFGSSISYDEGDHWSTLDTLNHTCVDMTNPVHGYSGGITSASGDDGVFIYSFPHAGPNSVVSAGNAFVNNQKVNVSKLSGNAFLPGNKSAVLRHHKYR